VASGVRLPERYVALAVSAYDQRMLIESADLNERPFDHQRTIVPKLPQFFDHRPPIAAICLTDSRGPLLLPGINLILKLWGPIGLRLVGVECPCQQGRKHQIGKLCSVAQHQASQLAHSEHIVNCPKAVFGSRIRFFAEECER